MQNARAHRQNDRPGSMWEVVDVDLAYILYHGDNEKDAGAYRDIIENQGHRAIIKEIKA